MIVQAFYVDGSPIGEPQYNLSQDQVLQAIDQAFLDGADNVEVFPDDESHIIETIYLDEFAA